MSDLPPSNPQEPTGGSAGGENAGGTFNPPPAGPPPTAPGMPTSDERTMALVAHISGIIVGFFGPLIIYVIKQNESRFVRDQAAEALNFQLTLLIAYLVAVVIAVITCGIGSVLFFVPWLAAIIFGILGGMAANNGQNYRYPMNIRFIK